MDTEAMSLAVLLCIAWTIELLLCTFPLIPLQPLDVGLFGPLKPALSKHQDNLFRLRVARIRKVELLVAYIKARETAFRSNNVFGGWRGVGLIPLNPHRVLRQLEPKTPTTSRTQILLVSTPDDVDLFETSLIASSPPDATELKRTNTAFRRRLGLETPLKTPEGGYAFRLSVTAEKLSAQSFSFRTREYGIKTVKCTAKGTNQGY
jgi:hypothetical protein